MLAAANYQPNPAAPGPYHPLASLLAAPTHPPGSPLHLDCSAPPCRLTLGVCHQVSQLLLLRRAGFEIYLHQVHPVLKASLHKLKVANLFAWGL